MWIFLSNAFLSIVDKGGDGSTLLVRARCKGDIESAFPQAAVETTHRNDYHYRARINREEVAQALAEAARAITYGNFKNTVMDRQRHDAYMDVWEAMCRFQQKGE